MKTIIRLILLFFCVRAKEKELPIDTSKVKVTRRKELLWINSKRIYTDPNGRKICEHHLEEDELQKIKEINLI